MLTLTLAPILMFILMVTVMALFFVGGIVGIIYIIRAIGGQSGTPSEQSMMAELMIEIREKEERIKSLEELLADNRDAIPDCINEFPEDNNERGHEMRIYRSRNGILAGVCSGIARRYEFDPIWLRIAFVVLAMSTLWPVILYFALVFILPVEPADLSLNQEDGGSGKKRRSPAFRSLEKTRDRLEQRLRNLEDLVTSKNYDWDRRLREREERP